MRISLQHDKILIENLEVTVLSQSGGLFKLIPVRTPKNPASVSLPGGQPVQVLPLDTQPVPPIFATQVDGSANMFLTNKVQTAKKDYIFDIVQDNNSYYYYPEVLPVIVASLSYIGYAGINCSNVGVSFASGGANAADLGYVRLGDGGAPFSLIGDDYPVLLPDPVGTKVLIISQINDADGLQANRRDGGPFKTALRLATNAPCEIAVEPTARNGPSIELVSDLAGITDTTQAHAVYDVNLLEKDADDGSSDHQFFPVRKIMMDRTGLTASFESEQIFATGGNINEVPDHQNTLCRISGDAHNLLRPYYGAVFFALGLSSRVRRKRRGRSKARRLSVPAAGDAMFTFTGEFYHMGMRDSANGPLRAFSHAIILAYPPTRSTLYAATDSGMLYLSYLKGKISPSKMIDATVSVGDLQLQLIDDISIGLRSVGFAEPGQPEFGRGVWTFLSAKATKTPFKGDAGAPQIENGSTFQEHYVPANGKSVQLRFDSFGLAYDKDILSQFIVEAGLKTQNAQPQNSTFTFNPGCTISRSLEPLSPNELLAMAQNRLSLSSKTDTVYTKIDADIELDVNVTNPNPQGPAPVTPILTWKDEFPDGLANNNLAALWTVIENVGGDLEDYLIQNFKQGANRLPLSNGWATLPFPEPYLNYDQQLIKLDLIKKNGQPASGELASINVYVDANKDLVFQILDIDGTPLAAFPPVRIGEDWKHLFDDDSLHPACPNWCGIIAAGTGISAPPGGVPSLMAPLIQQIPIKIAWFDGLGVTAVASLHVDLNDPNAKVICLPPKPTDPPEKTYGEYDVADVKNINNSGPTNDNPARIDLALIDFELIVRHNHIETLHFEFWWQMPFFDRQKSDGPTSPRQFVKIIGDWRVPEGGSQKQLVMTASLSDMTLEINWMGIDTVQINAIQFVCSNPTDPNPDWQIKIDGIVNLDAETIDLFKGTIKNLEFKGLTFDFGDPISAFKGFVFRLNTQLDIVFQGFNFKLLNFSIPNLNLSERTLKLNGDLAVALPLVSSFILPTVNLNIVFHMPMDLNWASTFKFENFELKDLDIKLFNFIELDGTVEWEDANRRFAGSITLLWNSGDSASPVGSVQFIMKSDGATYWAAGLTIGENQSLNLGFMTAQQIALIVAHRATHAGIRDAVLSLDLKGFQEAITKDTGGGTEEWLDQWEYDPHSTWLVGLYTGDLSICGDVFKGKNCSLFLTDGGVFRLGGDLTLCGVEFAQAMVAIDWANWAYAGSIALPNFSCGSYELDLGTIGLSIGKDGFQVDLGFPFNLDWSRSIKVHWTPTPWPIPINEVDGGMLFSLKKDPNGLKVITALAVRAGYSTMIGSDGGAFGAYVSGSILLGSVVTGEIGAGTMLLIGQVSLDINASGGVVVFGLRWNIITLFAHADVGYTVGIFDGQMVASFSADFSAGFTVCLTPCTCFSGSVSFGYSLSATSNNSYKVPSPDGALDFATASRVLRCDEPELAQIIGQLLYSHSKR